MKVRCQEAFANPNFFGKVIRRIGFLQDGIRRLKKSEDLPVPLQVVLVPQASQPRSAHYTARLTHHADRKYEVRAPEAMAHVEPYEFRPACRPQCTRLEAWSVEAGTWVGSWRTFFQLM